ncbi:hypothetical protein FVEN_g5824 [Fusarium venenatum]|uniref:C2H2-type domain-containing protein n=1 Tax=Fusarium venenatum TaxID=56646 RepID=A0A2L2TBI1_9HYPO|nr:uncharacterized protein FVRRES_03781 [Fusarium venenatum]KAG8356604.1 hypothetical protein FVEN_g5824 [Fusarium venenatum]CEI67269.1 unnamed protein product [Fusarium venenatum]
MSDQIDESTQHAAGDSPDATAPAKPSLRVLEPGLSSRQEDLDNGPLLLALGDGLEDPVIPYPGLDLVSQYPGHRRLEGIELPFMPLRRLEVLDMGPESLPSVSQSGTSLSVPLEGSVVWGRGVFSFSQSYEFSWQKESGLCFGGEPFGVARTPDDRFSKVDLGSERVLSEPHEPTASLMNQDSRDGLLPSLSIAGIGSSMEDLSPAILHGDLELESTTSSVSSSTASSSGTIDFDAIAEPSDPQLVRAMQSYAEWAVELLMDDFYRSCAPQASKARATRASENVTGSALDNVEGKRRGVNGRSRVEPKSGKRKAVGGDEESEDEGAQDKKRKPSVTEESLRWACPYVKWRPMNYHCKNSPTQLRVIKEHIANVHWKEHCDRCWRWCSTSEEKAAHRFCQVKSGPPPGFMTKEMKFEIFEKKPSGLSHEKQWFRFYEILFSGESQGFSPYVNKAMGNFMDLVEVFFRGPQARKIRDEVISESQFEGPECEQAIKMICDEYLKRMCRDYDLKNDLLCTPALRETQVIENTQYSQVDAAGMDKEITECEPLYHASPSSPKATPISHQFCGSKPAEIAMFDQNTSAGDRTLENNNFSTLASPAEFQGPVGSVKPRDSEDYLWENSDSASPGYFEDAWFSNSQMDRDYQETILNGRDWVGNELLPEQAW